MATPKSKAYMDAVTSEMRDFTPSGGGSAGSGKGTTGDAPARGPRPVNPKGQMRQPPSPRQKRAANIAKKSKRYPLPPVTG